MESWANIAVLLKAKDAEGGLFVKTTKGLPFLLTKGLEVAFVPPVLRVPRNSRVSRVEQTHDGRWVVYFEGITSRDVSERLSGHYCLVRRSDVPAEAFRAQLSLVGFTVADGEQGMIGQVVRVEENPAHPLLVVRPFNADVALDADQPSQPDQAAEPSQLEPSEYLIPLVEEFIHDLDEENKLLTLNLPAGLLDL